MHPLTLYATLLIAPGVLLPALARADAPDGRPVRNSFVDHRVRSAQELLAHVRADRVVADRYMRHFAMDWATMLRYLGGLHAGRLAKAGTFTIYSVPKGGWLKMHVGRLPKGEPMFLDRAGHPILVVRCGNPVTLGPRPGRRANDDLGLSEPEGERGMPLADSLLSEPMALLPEPLEVVPTATAVTVALAMGPVTSIPTVGASGLGSGYDVLGGLSLLPFFGSNGHSERPDVPRSTPPVPEPGALAALAGGLASLAQGRRKRT